MEKVEPMDILRAPSPEEVTIAKIGKWIKDSYYDENHQVNVVFKKDTPKEVFRSFKKNTILFKAITDADVNEKYQIEK
ncbi:MULTISPECIES: hypothetical protein [Lactobacillus]|nr:MULTISPECIES: hypothetical protein [Lactobacillus]